MDDIFDVLALTGGLEELDRILSKHIPAGGTSKLRKKACSIKTIKRKEALDNPNPVPKKKRFDLDSLDDDQCMTLFRFKKEHIKQLVRLFNLPKYIDNPGNFTITGLQGLCILLRRLVYPNRLSDMTELFHLSISALSIMSNVMLQIIFQKKGHLLKNIFNLSWLTEYKLQQYAYAISAKGAPVQNCWGFIDIVSKPMCRPTHDHKSYYCSDSQIYCMKYQSVVCPDGMIVSTLGPFKGSYDTPSILAESGFYEQLEQNTFFHNKYNKYYVLYGNQLFPSKQLIMKPYISNMYDMYQSDFNQAMGSLQHAAEWSLSKVTSEFPLVDFAKNLKIELQEVGAMYQVATLLANCNTCLYGSQTGDYFELNPITLEQYLS